MHGKYRMHIQRVTLPCNYCREYVRGAVGIGAAIVLIELQNRLCMRLHHTETHNGNIAGKETRVQSASRYKLTAVSAHTLRGTGTLYYKLTSSICHVLPDACSSSQFRTTSIRPLHAYTHRTPDCNLLVVCGSFSAEKCQASAVASTSTDKRSRDKNHYVRKMTSELATRCVWLNISRPT